MWIEHYIFGSVTSGEIVLYPGCSLGPDVLFSKQIALLLSLISVACISHLSWEQQSLASPVKSRDLM